jgi:hypothetical protein
VVADGRMGQAWLGLPVWYALMFVQYLDPGCHVEGDDHGRRPWDPADYPGDLVGGPVV